MRLLFLILMSPIVLCACKKESTSNNLDGHYTGIFSVSYQSEDPHWYDTAYLEDDVTVWIENGQFSSSANPKHIPAGGSGTLEINNESILFSDTNIWLNDFDHSLILHGEYAKLSDGEQLILIKKGALGEYTYRLKQVQE